jgi:hypothetical protein
MASCDRSFHLPHSGPPTDMRSTLRP